MAFRVDGVSASYSQWQRSYATVDAAWASWVPVVSVVWLLVYVDFSDLRRQHKEIRSWLQLGGLRLVLAPRGRWWTPWFVCVASGRCSHYGHGYPCLGQ